MIQRLYRAELWYTYTRGDYYSHRAKLSVREFKAESVKDAYAKVMAAAEETRTTIARMDDLESGVKTLTIMPVGVLVMDKPEKFEWLLCNKEMVPQFDTTGVL